MSTIPFEDYESEADFDGDSEDYESDFDSESEDFEDARSDALRRRRAARARGIRAAQLRAAQARTRSPGVLTSQAAPTGTPTPRQAVAAIRHLDLEQKVAGDSLRSAIGQANRRAERATYATVASVGIDQAFDTFEADLKGHEFVRAGLRLSPLLLLSPQRRRPGVEGVLRDPRFVGVAAVAGLVAVGHFRSRDDDVEDIVFGQTQLDSGVANGRLLAVAVNKKGADAGQDVTWRSSDAALQLDPSGTFRIPQPVTTDTLVKVTATAGRTSKTAFLRLTPPAAGSGQTAGPTVAAGGQAAASGGGAGQGAQAKHG